MADETPTPGKSGESGKKVMPIGRRFEPGASGNPSGRPKKSRLTQELEKLVNDPKQAIAAAKDVFTAARKDSGMLRQVLDRTEGPVTTKVEFTANVSDFVKITAHVLSQRPEISEHTYMAVMADLLAALGQGETEEGEETADD